VNAVMDVRVCKRQAVSWLADCTVGLSRGNLRRGARYMYSESLNIKLFMLVYSVLY
jgi:hypothetical protein